MPTPSTSGTNTFNYNRNQLCNMAARKLGAIAANETLDAGSIQDFSDQLNMMIKAWMASGIHIWTTVEAIMFVQIGQIQYTLGPGSTDNVTQIYTNTVLATNAANGATSVVLASAMSATIGGTIGVTLDSGFIFWTTIGSVVGTSIGLVNPLTDSATLGNPVYIDSPNISRPLRIPAARRWNVISNIETPLMPMSRMDYEALPNKTALGEVTQFYYNPQGGAVNVGAMFLWPAPADTISNNIKFTWYRPIQDFDTAGNLPDFPQEWLNALMWNLALQMTLEYDVPDSRYMKIEKQALAALDLVSGWDREPQSAYFGVDFSQMGRNG